MVRSMLWHNGTIIIIIAVQTRSSDWKRKLSTVKIIRD